MKPCLFRLKWCIILVWCEKTFCQRILTIVSMLVQICVHFLLIFLFQLLMSLNTCWNQLVSRNYGKLNTGNWNSLKRFVYWHLLHIASLSLRNLGFHNQKRLWKSKSLCIEGLCKFETLAPVPFGTYLLLYSCNF